MHDLSGQKILQCERPGNSSNQKSATPDITANRASRVHYQAKNDFASTNQSSLARHVDFAAVATEIAKSTSGVPVHLSVHTSPYHACRPQTSRAAEDIFKSKLV
jgi:hypothetical protein